MDGHLIIAVIIFAAAICSALLILVRIHVVFYARGEAFKIVSEKAHFAIDERQPWRHYFSELHAYGSYEEMILHFDKWTFDDFYPGFADKQSEAKDDGITSTN